MQNTKDRPVVIAGTRKNRVSEEATRLNIAEGTLKKFVKAGIIPAIKIGTMLLFDPAQVDEALAKYNTQNKEGK
jgi:excisionase family DNA binding protein